jgi:hypothetical protein
MSDIEFWKKRPKPPNEDFRAWSLGIPSFLSALGFVCFAILGFSFKEFQVLPSGFRTVIVLMGAISLAIGGEMGTITTTVEIFRKYKRDAVIWWDWASLIVSVLTTISASLVAASYLPEVEGRAWSLAIQAGGPVVLMILAPIDAYFGFIELGLYVGEYDERMVSWEIARDKYEKREFDALLRQRRAESHESDTELPKSDTDSHEPDAKLTPSIHDWREIVHGLNGDRANMDWHRVNDILEEHGFERKPQSTARYWAKVAKETTNTAR